MSLPSADIDDALDSSDPKMELIRLIVSKQRDEERDLAQASIDPIIATSDEANLNAPVYDVLAPAPEQAEWEPRLQRIAEAKEKADKEAREQAADEEGELSGKMSEASRNEDSLRLQSSEIWNQTETEKEIASIGSGSAESSLGTQVLWPSAAALHTLVKKREAGLNKVHKALRSLVRKYGLCYAGVWRPHAKFKELLVLDLNSSYQGTAVDYFEVSRSFSFLPGQGLVGRVWAGKANELIPNISYLSTRAFPRKKLAMKHNIRSTFAVIGADAVYDFCSTQELFALPFATVDVDKVNEEASQRRALKQKQREKQRMKKNDKDRNSARNDADLSQNSPEETGPAIEKRNSEKSDRDVSAHEGLEFLCELHGLSCCMVWKLQDGLLKMDEELSCSVSSPDFYEESKSFQLKIGQGLPGRVWKSKSVEFIANVQQLDKSIYLRIEVAKKYNIRTSFGIFSDDAVYEFATTDELATCPFRNL